jgi:biopolymer transport protein ExbD
MTRSFVYKPSARSGDVGFNMTPLIDCTFLLIIFFILASQMASDSLATLELPRPFASQAVSSDRREVRRLIVNVPSAEGEGLVSPNQIGQAAGYKIEGRWVEVGDYETLVDLLRSRRQAAGAGGLFLEVRADRRVQFGHVQPVMDAAAEAGIDRVNLTALLESGKKGG